MVESKGLLGAQSPRWKVARQHRAVLSVALAALIMGLPALRGGFVGGDDHRLVLDHVLVNHPSIEHALELFRIVHRDLYQPVPLLTFQMEFLVAKVLGLYSQGAESLAWLLHLTNVLIHVANSVLVFHLLRRLHALATSWYTPNWFPRWMARLLCAQQPNFGLDETHRAATSVNFVALFGALLFAIHPLGVETVAWINGRMFLLSTFFLLTSVLSFMRWLDRPRWTWGLFVLLFVVLSAISKVRAGLPIMLAMVVLLRGKRPDTRTIMLWIGCALLTGIFVVVNIGATSAADLFEEAAEHLKGPRLVRIALALAWYFQHYVWPSGLASYYPTPLEVSWWSAATLRAFVTIAAAGVVLLLAVRRLCCTPWAVVLFLLGIGDTLPFFPARNVLAADRYMYLPIIGFTWITAELVCRIRSRIELAKSPGTARTVFRCSALSIGIACIAQAWQVEASYDNSLAKTYRIAEVFPDEPRVWEYYGWSLHSRGRYRDAIEAAKKELVHEHARVRSGAYQLMGMSELKLGAPDQALELLQRALDIDPENVLGLYRMGMAREELGQFSEAISSYEKAVEIAPRSNPTIQRLAKLYARVGSPDDARKAFEHELVNNPYEVPALSGLSELDIAARTPASLNSAVERLRSLLKWMPENSVARVNLGVALSGLGRRDEAVGEYVAALASDSSNATAAINLGQIYAARNKIPEAVHLFEQASESAELTIDQALVIQDFLVDHDMVDAVGSLWQRFAKMHGRSREIELYMAWSAGLAGQIEDCRKLLGDARDGSALMHAAFALCSLQESQFPAAISNVDELAKSGDAGRDVRRRMLASLEFFDRRHPGTPWVFCLAVPLLIADQQADAANVFLGQCQRLCGVGPACDYAAELGRKVGR
ncbi:MAG: tetratricopeptide repeat protein [Planctomycetes bacterium]|nr:tetratricopeptide repeat protein [Planctomycetota bacterium]MBI3835708.1 tetratricopeptide repeat protein [Planctomycetota bacterium]